MTDPHFPAGGRLAVLATPDSGLIDEPVRIRVEGARPGEEVELRASLCDPGGMRWSARAAFRADRGGQVDLARDAPVTGSYRGLDPMGLVWSLAPEAPEGSVAGPFEPPLGEAVRVEVVAATEAKRADTGFTRHLLAAGVARSEVDAGGLVATAFHPSTPRPAPGVIVLGGSGGGLPRDLAAVLASRGYATLAVAYFGVGDLPSELVEIPLEHLEKAVRWMTDRRDVAAPPLGLVGRSRGGELALLLASHAPQVGCVVAYAPSGVALWGVTAQGWCHRPAWRCRGEGVPFLRPPPADAEHDARRRQPFAGTPLIRSQLGHAGPSLQRATIPVERINGEVVLISGRDDAMWPATDLADIAHRRRQRAGRPCEHLRYDGAGHLVSYPYVPTTVTEAAHPLTGQTSAFGGTPAATATANADSWPRVLAALHRSLGNRESAREHGKGKV